MSAIPQIKQELDELRTFNPLLDILIRNGLKQVNFKAIAQTYVRSINS